MERQLTTARHGHILTNTGCWSRDSQWLVYDTRSDAAGSQFDGRWIERVHVATGRVERLFESQHGAHCGVVTCCPVSDRIVFIHGPEAPTLDWQYGPYHRRGVILDLDATSPATLGLEANCYAPPLVPGALRGGSHVHTWDPSGKRVAFTYEDHLLAVLDRHSQPTAQRNQRNVGVSDPVQAVSVPKTHPRNHDGTHWSVLVTQTVDQPQPGSDQIDRAYEDAWLGRDGQRLSFLGDVVGRNGQRFTELFVLELPEDLTQPGEPGPLEGTPLTRPNPPRGCIQRRLTYTQDRPQPGLVSPRHWPRSTPDGAYVFCLMSDEHKRPQLFRVSVVEGGLVQITSAVGGVASAFSVSHDGQWVAYVADGQVWLTSVDGQVTRRLASGQQLRPEACVISPDNRYVAYVQHIASFNQIFVCEI